MNRFFEFHSHSSCSFFNQFWREKYPTSRIALRVNNHVKKVILKHTNVLWNISRYKPNWNQAIFFFFFLPTSSSNWLASPPIVIPSRIITGLFWELSLGTSVAMVFCFEKLSFDLSCCGARHFWEYLLEPSCCLARGVWESLLDPCCLVGRVFEPLSDKTCDKTCCRFWELFSPAHFCCMARHLLEPSDLSCVWNNMKVQPWVKARPHRARQDRSQCNFQTNLSFFSFLVQRWCRVPLTFVHSWTKRTLGRRYCSIFSVLCKRPLAEVCTAQLINTRL